MPSLEEKRTATLQELGRAGPLVAASMAEAKRICGRPSCRCAQGEPHWAWALTFKVEGKTRTVHVPKDMVEEVKGWVEEHKRIKELIHEISALSVEIIRNHVSAARAAKSAEKRRAR